MSTRKKLIAIGLCLVILAVTILNGTIAYFTDEQAVSNTFTSGNVKITLDEAKATVDANSNRVEVSKTERVSSNQSYGTLYPMQTFTKDPTITNVSTEAAYIAAKVTISDGVVPSAEGAADDVTNLSAIIPFAEGSELIDISMLLSGGILGSGDNKITVYTNKADVATALESKDYVVYQDKENGNYVFYFFVKDAVAVNEKVELFDTFTVPATWDNAEMNHLKALNIKVEAYGVQTFGFDTALDAVQAAFKDNGFTGFSTTVNP